MRPFSKMMGRPPKQQAMVAQGAASASEALKIPMFRDSLHLFSDELARARRYQHPLTVLVTRPQSDQAREIIRRPHDAIVANVLEKTFLQLVFFTLGSVLMDSLRSTDKVSYDASSHVYIALLTESTRKEAKSVVRRVDGFLYDRIAVRLAAGASEFPRRGFTLEDLVESAKEECLHRPMTIMAVGDETALGSA